MKHDVSRVAVWLLVGSAIAEPEHLTWLIQQGVTHLVSAACEVGDRWVCLEHDLGYYHLLWFDGHNRKPASDFLGVLKWVIAEQDRASRTGSHVCLYIHCQKGVNRSPLLATFLLAALDELSADEAWNRVKRARPVAEAFNYPAYRESVVAALEEWQQLRRDLSLPGN